MSSVTSTAASPGEEPVREGADRGLERAALRLLTSGGLLAGFSLQQVGDEAGVTKGLVYHYFGDRQALLRSALRHGAAEIQQTLAEMPYAAYDRRMLHFAKAALAHPDAIQLTALLLVDRDPRLRTMPIRERTMASFVRDLDEGRLPPEADVEALLGVQNALVYGYVLFRDGLARQMGVDRERLDARFRRLVTAMGRAAAAADWTSPPAEIPPAPAMSRPPADTSTPGLLENAALDLLDEQGILAGVNLRSVAERAGVHRGLVYHYFGSRRELLLAALRQRRAGVGRATSRGGVPGDLLFAAGIRDGQPVRLMTLLALDGDESYEPFGPVPDRVRLTTRDMAGVAVALGHALYRHAFAREMRIAQRAWDRRVFAAWARVAPAR